MAGTAAAALPPLLPTPPKDRMVGLLPTPPPTSCIVPTSVSPVQSASSSERRDWGKKPGRASSSESWVTDKMLGCLLSDESGERVGRAPARGSSNGGKRPASRAPSVDRCDKKPRPETEADSAAQLFAGPTFIVSPDPGALPIPCFVKAH